MHTDQSNQDLVDSHLIGSFIMLFHKLCYFTECAISQKIAEILYGHYVCDAINYTIIAFMNSPSVCCNTYNHIHEFSLSLSWVILMYAVDMLHQRYWSLSWLTPDPGLGTQALLQQSTYVTKDA